MEIHSVALGYVGDKIRNIAIRIRFTTEFFFEHGFIGLTRIKYQYIKIQKYIFLCFFKKAVDNQCFFMYSTLCC